jgi:hypothetical protein
MEAKIEEISELSNLLRVKSKIGDDLLSLMGRFGIGRILRRYSLEKKEGVSATALIQSLCLFCVLGESIHSMYRQKFFGLLERGKNCYYRLLNRSSMDWRSLQLGMVKRFSAIVRKEGAEESGVPTCFIIDDTTLEKSGKRMECISRVFDHTLGSCVLGYKLLILAVFDGRSTLPCDFSIHREKGKSGNFGLDGKSLRKQFHKKRSSDTPASQRRFECDQPKPGCAIEMMRRAIKHGIRACYVLADSWFASEWFIGEVRKLGLHYVGLAKMDATKYLVDGRRKNPLEMVTSLERKAKSCRKFKCKYISVKGTLGGQPVRIFLIRYGRNKNWNILLTTDLSMDFTKAFETYQIRWNIEVLIKENKQYLGLGSYQGRDFDGQVADTTLRFITYIVLSLDKRFSEYETMGVLFADKREDLLALTLWQRILGLIGRLLETLSEALDIPPGQMIAKCIADDGVAKQYAVMMDALSQYAARKEDTD